MHVRERRANSCKTDHAVRHFLRAKQYPRSRPGLWITAQERTARYGCVAVQELTLARTAPWNNRGPRARDRTRIFTGDTTAVHAPWAGRLDQLDAAEHRGTARQGGLGRILGL